MSHHEAHHIQEQSKGGQGQVGLDLVQGTNCFSCLMHRLFRLSSGESRDSCDFRVLKVVVKIVTILTFVTVGTVMAKVLENLKIL